MIQFKEYYNRARVGGSRGEQDSFLDENRKL